MNLVRPTLKHVNREALNSERQRRINSLTRNARIQGLLGPPNHSFPKKYVNSRRNRRTRRTRK